MLYTIFYILHTAIVCTLYYVSFTNTLYSAFFLALFFYSIFYPTLPLPLSLPQPQLLPLPLPLLYSTTQPSGPKTSLVVGWFEDFPGAASLLDLRLPWWNQRAELKKTFAKPSLTWSCLIIWCVFALFGIAVRFRRFFNSLWNFSLLRFGTLCASKASSSTTQHVGTQRKRRSQSWEGELEKRKWRFVLWRLKRSKRGQSAKLQVEKNSRRRVSSPTVKKSKLRREVRVEKTQEWKLRRAVGEEKVKKWVREEKVKKCKLRREVSEEKVKK